MSRVDGNSFGHGLETSRRKTQRNGSYIFTNSYCCTNQENTRVEMLNRGVPWTAAINYRQHDRTLLRADKQWRVLSPVQTFCLASDKKSVRCPLHPISKSSAADFGNPRCQLCINLTQGRRQRGCLGEPDTSRLAICPLRHAQVS